MKKLFPLFTSLQNYNKSIFTGDLSAGLTVGVMLIPQGMAYAMIAGLPPVYGLYASTIPLIIYALLGTSRQLAVGPVAMVSLLTAAGIGTIASGGIENYIALAITLAFMVGTIQFALGISRLGFLVTFLSHPVISGFTSAAALIIGLSQLKHLLGLQLSRTNYIHEILTEAIQNINSINWVTFALGAGGILVILGLRRVNKKIPGLLVAVILGILITWVLKLKESGVSIVGEVPRGLPEFIIPQMSFSTISVLFPIAMAISLVSFMESIAVAKAIQSKHKNYKINPNQELIALGMANIGGSFFQSYPTTGGFSRTAINDQAGAKTNFAAIISAILILLTLLYLTPLFFYLPNAILASVIMVAVFSLIDIKEARYLWNVNRSDFWMLSATFISTLVFGIEQGIGLGVILSLAVIIYKTTRPHIAILGQIPETHIYRNVERFKEINERPDLLIIRFDAQLYFANAQYFRDQIEGFIDRKKELLKAIIINAESINNIDSSAVHMLEELCTDIRSRGIVVYFSGIIGPVRDVFVKSNLLDKVGPDNFFLSVQEAVDYHDENIHYNEHDGLKKFALQSDPY